MPMDLRGVFNSIKNGHKVHIDLYLRLTQILILYMSLFESRDTSVYSGN